LGSTTVDIRTASLLTQGRSDSASAACEQGSHNKSLRFSQIGAVNAFKKIAKTGNISGEMGIAELAEDAVLFTPILIYGL
jgi:hypothetical protein